MNLLPTPAIAGVLGDVRLISAATNNATVVKAGPGSVALIVASNVNAAVRYLKFYNKATTPAPASDNTLLKLVVALPPGSVNQVIAPPCGIQFSSGISFALVTGITDTDNTAVAISEQLVYVQYV